ncbi:protein of unknown function [Sterolibacterium denitrificans]|uniref:Uncharacterized protein n=1 Tax=Sterolibacterium denitrificans TaxID=157592 RepID=A0A7Z7HRI6_9PROT|nr:protein of unknown function [Sterolibacterium denitrificans]
MRAFVFEKPRASLANPRTNLEHLYRPGSRQKYL